MPKKVGSNEGAQKLNAFMRAFDHNQVTTAQALKVSVPTVHDWLAGKKRPRSIHRAAIARWTNGAVPVDCWESAEERKALGRIRPHRMKATVGV